MPSNNRDMPINSRVDANTLLDAIRHTAVATSATNSENIFRDLVKHLAQALVVDHAFIGILEPGSADIVRVVAGYFFGEFNDDFTYELENTPCEDVIGQQFRYYPNNVQSRFTDPMLIQLGTEGYAGIPLFDSRNNVHGIMAVACSKPLHDQELTENLLKIFSVRAAVELERRNVEKAHGEKENELHKSENRLRITVASSIDCILAIDREGYILEFNPAAEECFGYKKFDILGKPISPLIIPERYHQYFDQGMEEFRKTGSGAFLGNRVELVLMRSDGSEFPVEMAIDVAPGSDSEILIGYIRDITERRDAENRRHQLEKQLQQAQKMEAIGQLTGGIAHDFNNILTTMTGYMVLAEEHNKAKGDEKLAKYLDRSLRSGKRATDLIQQMLTFSRGQNGEPRPVALASTIDEWINLLESTLPSSIEIKTDLDSNIPATMIDPVQIEQVLMNLCINARDAMQGNGTLTVKLTQQVLDNCICASCRQAVDGSFIEISVNDTGCGISTETQERMFEPFYSTKEVGHGSGMGLSMVHGIVHEYGGHLVVNSSPANGSSFRVLLKPIDSKTIQTDETEFEDRQDEVKPLKGHVLLVDDEAAVSEFMQDLLENWGLSVSVFNNGIDACRAFSDNMDEYDIVILDQIMPKMTGIDAASNILKLRPGLPVILYSGYSDNISESRASQLGLHAMIKKPVDTSGLYRLIRNILTES